VVGKSRSVDTLNYIAYMLRYELTHGRFKKGRCRSATGSLIVNGRSIRVTAERDPRQLNWGGCWR